jgi:hypothetical protein
MNKVAMEDAEAINCGRVRNNNLMPSLIEHAPNATWAVLDTKSMQAMAAMIAGYFYQTR